MRTYGLNDMVITETTVSGQTVKVYRLHIASLNEPGGHLTPAFMASRQEN